MLQAVLATVLAGALLGSDQSANNEALVANVEKAERNYDLPLAESLMEDLHAYTRGRTEEQALWALARVSLVVAELRRMDYETGEEGPREKRILGRTIDEAAELGHAALDALPDSSETWRLRADLYATMIRSKYKGNKYGRKMENATERALELGPDNPNAIVTGSKKPLFAGSNHGGDVSKALELLNKALEIDPDHERALIFRSIAYDKIDMPEQANGDRNRALELNPKSRLAREKVLATDFGLK